MIVAFVLIFVTVAAVADCVGHAVACDPCSGFAGGAAAGGGACSGVLGVLVLGRWWSWCWGCWWSWCWGCLWRWCLFWDAGGACSGGSVGGGAGRAGAGGAGGSGSEGVGVVLRLFVCCLGQHDIAIETLVQAISIIKQSPVAHEETSQVETL